MSFLEYEILPMTEADLDEVTLLERECFSVPWSRDSFEDVMKYSFLGGFCARVKGELAGYGVFHSLFEDGEILDIAVGKSFRGLGIAKKLMSFMESEAALRGACRMMLEVRRSNAEARGLYLGLGYKETGVRKNYYKNPTEDAILMEKVLSSEEKE